MRIKCLVLAALLSAGAAQADMYSNQVQNEAGSSITTPEERLKERQEKIKNMTDAERKAFNDRYSGQMTDAERKAFNDRYSGAVTEEDQKRMNQRLDSVKAAADAMAKDAKDNDDTEANPVCEVVLCMFGKLKGASQSECSSAEKKYFKIIKKKKKKFNASRTAKARLDFLNGCPSPENKAINDKFGKMRIGF